MKWWRIFNSKTIKLNIPFLNINTVYLKKNFNSIKSNLINFFFYKQKPVDLLNIDYIWPKAFFQNIIIYKDFFSKFLSSLTVFRFFSSMIKFMNFNEQRFDNNFYFYFNYVKRIFSGIYWFCFNTNQKKTFIFNDKFKSIFQLSEFYYFFNYPIFKFTEIFNYFFNLQNKYSLANIKRFLYFQKSGVKRSFNNFYNINKFFQNKYISLSKK